MRAILLAAGMGTRLRPLTYETPKSLIKVNGKPLLERQIEYLRKVGVEEIVVLTGYLNDKFEYLKEKYNVKLIYNDKYDVYNNIYSMYLVKEYLPDAYVIDGDTYLKRNFLKKELKTSTYFSGIKENFENEWIVNFNESGRIYDLIVGSGKDYIMSGVSYWTEKDGNLLKEKLEEAMKSNNWQQLYWDNIAKDNLFNMDVYINIIHGDDWFEIDSIEDLKELKNLVAKSGTTHKNTLRLKRNTSR